MSWCRSMSRSGDAKRLLDVLRCITTILEVLVELFPDWVPVLEELEDEIADRLQDLR